MLEYKEAVMLVKIRDAYDREYYINPECIVYVEQCQPNDTRSNFRIRLLGKKEIIVNTLEGVCDV